jgi:branched-chain amino acid aminotransferase
MSIPLHFELKPTSQPQAADERRMVLADPGFGRYFTDHMITIQWSSGRGWHDAQLIPYAPLELSPGTMVFHYAQAIFEGLKAYRRVDGTVGLFRPEVNAHRFSTSADRLALPRLPEEVFLDSIRLLVSQDREWIPDQEEHSLYLRPFLFATELGLGVRPAAEAAYLLIASPVGAYFANGVQPVSVWLSDDYSRAAPGGTGEAKCAGNYAASLAGQAQAMEHGCDQVVWLDAVEHRWVEEMGGMNLFFVEGSGDDVTLRTPALTGTLLPGVTRDSLLTLGRDLGYRVVEDQISTDEWREGNASGAITEVFACGTAAVITPVGSVKSSTAEWTVGDGTPGPVTMRLRQALLDIQYGAAPDPHGWTTIVE